MLAGMLAVLMMAQSPVIPPVSPSSPHPVPVKGSADAMVLGAINAADADMIEAGTLAGTKASNGDVKKLAILLVHDHRMSLADGDTLAKRYNITRLLPSDSVAARAHKDGMTQLNVLSGSAFDKAFVQMVITSHRAELDKIRTSFLASAKLAAVKEFVRHQVLPLTSHLHTAEAWLKAHP